jgi:methionyl-tRNA formyltransferase
LPDLIVAAPDKPAGRGKNLTPPLVKIWAEEHGIKILQPEKLDPVFSHQLTVDSYDLFIVASYGKIIPKETLEIPKYGSLNIHPSLLPRFRGASPIESQILLDEKIVGVSIILMDEKMDHGPILSQEILEPESWPPKASLLEEKLAKIGGELLASVIPEWIEGNIESQEQDHKQATFTKKITKDDALIKLEDDPYENLLKIRAYDKWPRAYFFVSKGNTSASRRIRITITEAHLENKELVIDRVIPEGKKEMNWSDFERNL